MKYKKQMKTAVVSTDFSLTIENRPILDVGPDDVLIKTAYCGICGSDIHFITSRTVPPGTVLGHELSGYIMETGKNINCWKEGDSVVVMPLDACGKCYACQSGNTNHCKEGLSRTYGIGNNPGGFSNYMLVKPGMLFKVPAGLDIKTASLTEPMAVSFRGVNTSGISKGEHALVMGAGPIGLFCIYALKKAGAGQIFVSEPDPFRAEKAMAAGADKVLNPEKDAIGKIITSVAGRLPKYIFECAGTASSMQEASNLIQSQGHIIMLGVYQGNTSIFPMIWFAKEIRLSFCFGYSQKEFEESIALLADNTVDPNVVISDTYPLSKINDCFNMLKASGHTKIVLDCQDV